jgi:alpha-beta hydrolase superfamily lysophospholipase
MIDLPGHGLSSGERGNISDFEDYQVVIDSAVSYYNKYQLPGELSIIAHSTGCAIALDRISRGKTWNGKTVFIAPLVHSQLWGLSHFGYELIKSFTQSTPRLFRTSSHDKDFLKFLKEEPLAIKSFPLDWGDAVYRWDKIISQAKFKDEKIIILQGTEDETLDWKYNLKFFKNRFKSVEIHKIDGAYHHLANESEPYNSVVYSILDKVF